MTLFYEGGKKIVKRHKKIVIALKEKGKVLSDFVKIIPDDNANRYRNI